jgi:hypothetical protein
LRACSENENIFQNFCICNGNSHAIIIRSTMKIGSACMRLRVCTWSSGWTSFYAISMNDLCYFLKYLCYYAKKWTIIYGVCPMQVLVVGPGVWLTRGGSFYLVHGGAHYRKHLNFRGPKTHENKRKPTKQAIFVGMTTKIAAENMFDENRQLFLWYRRKWPIFVGFPKADENRLGICVGLGGRRK